MVNPFLNILDLYGHNVYLDANWSCAGSATLRIVSQKEGKEDHVRRISHIFHAKENDWGFAQFLTFDVSESHILV